MRRVLVFLAGAVVAAGLVRFRDTLRRLVVRASGTEIGRVARFSASEGPEGL